MFKVEENDGLPQKVCSTCIEHANTAYIFKRRCEEVDEKLRFILSRIPTSPIPEPEEIKPTEPEIKEEPIEKYYKIESPERTEEKNIEAIKNYFSDEYFNDEIKWDDDIKDPIRKSTCNICNKTVNTRYLKSHLRIHSKEKPYACDTCNLKFSLRENLRRHEKIHTGERPYQCEFCDKTFIQAGAAKIHRRTHTGETPYCCELCGKSFKQKSSFQTHIATQHSDNAVTDEKKRGYKLPRIRRSRVGLNAPRPFICDICDKKFVSKHVLRQHKRSHDINKLILCNHCGKGYTNKSNLDLHMIVHTGVKEFKCNECGKAFARPGALKTHMLKHTGERPFKCDTCGKTFTQGTHLRQHWRVHEGVKPYVCQFCDKSFAQKGNLTIHMRIHTGETPFSCSICRKGFYDSSSMRKHELGHLNKI